MQHASPPAPAAILSGPAGRRPTVRVNWLAYAMLVPAVAVVTAVLLVPLAVSLRMSLSDWSLLQPVHRWVGLTNYRHLLADQGTLMSLRITMIYTGVAIALEAVLGMATALLLNMPFRAIRLIRTL